MANAAILYLNLVDAGTVTASTSIADGLPGLVQDPHVAVKWRSTSATAHLIVDLGSSVSIDTVAAIGLAASTIRVRLSTVDATGAAGDAYDSGTPAAVDQDYRQHITILSAPVTARYLRIDLVHAALAYVECGRLVAGLRHGFDYNFGYGWSFGHGDPSVRTQSIGRQTTIDPRPTYRWAEANFEWLSQADRDGFVETIDRDVGLKRDLLFMLDPASAKLPRDTIWGLLADVSPVTQPFFDIFSKTYRIEERG